MLIDDMIGITEVVPGSEMKKEDRDRQKKKKSEREAVQLLNRVQELTLLDGDELRKHPTAMKVLKTAHNQLGSIISGNISEDDAQAKVKELGFGEDDS